jgi:IS5 family transposase
MVFLQGLYNLSDEQCEHQVLDRLSFQRFCRLEGALNIPDARTLWNFRQRHGFIPRGGQIVDASIVQANAREREALNKGEAPEGWSKKRLAHTDRDARWTIKHGKSYYGHKLLCQMKITTAKARLKQRNKTINRTRARLEHVFAALGQQGGKCVRAMTLAITLLRAQAEFRASGPVSGSVLRARRQRRLPLQRGVHQQVGLLPERKVPAGDAVQAHARLCAVRPARHLLRCGVRVLVRGQGRDRTAQALQIRRTAGHLAQPPHEPEIGLEQWQHQRQQLRMLEHRRRRAAQRADMGGERGIGQGVRVDAGRVLRAAAGGQHEALRERPAGVLQALRQRMGHEGAHAVAEQDERSVQPGLDGLLQGIQQHPRVIDVRFGETRLAARQLDRAQVDVGGHQIEPVPKEGPGSPGIRQAEQAQSGRCRESGLPQPARGTGRRRGGRAGGMVRHGEGLRWRGSTWVSPGPSTEGASSAGWGSASNRSMSTPTSRARATTTATRPAQCDTG